MKKLLLLCTFCATMLAAHATVYSDTHGSFSWNLDTETGILEFSGTGEIVNYSGSWSDYKAEVRSIVINQGITSLSAYIFQSYDSLRTVSLPEGLERIGASAFWGCRALSSCNLPSTLRKIGQSAFYACALTSAVIPEGVDTLNGTFSQNTSLKTVSIPSTVNYFNAPFSNCHIESVTLAEGLKAIPADMFSRDYLKTINIPSSFTSIPRSCFYNCSALKNVTIAAGVDSICEYAFYGCSSLESIELPEGLKYIGENAFRNAGIVSMTIPSTVTKMESYAFNCENLQTLIIDNAVIDIPDYSFSYCANLKTVSFGNGIKSIGYQAFNRCTSLETVTFPSACAANSIWGGNAFMNCDSLKSIVIPEGVDSLGDCVLGYCDALESVSFPSTVTKFGKNVLTSCPSLSNIHFAEGLKSCPKSVFSGLSGSLKSINIPASFGSIPAGYLETFKVLENVTIADGIDTIGSFAFAGCTALKSIALPDGLKFIGPSAFSSSGLTSITIPSTVTFMGQRAFYQCTSLTQAQILNAAISNEAFQQCSNLSQVTLGDRVRTIGNSAFASCNVLKSVDLNNVISIGSAAFSSCSALKKVNLSSSLQYLGGSAFSRTGLTEIDIPSSISNVGSVFYSCKALSKVNIAEGVDSLSSSFQYCGTLASIDIPSTVTYISTYTFDNDTIQKMYVHWLDPSIINVYPYLCDKTDTLYVPAGTKSLYKDVYPWRRFQYILEMPLKTYDLWINGKQLNERNYQHIVDSVPDVLADDISFDPATNTLSLHNAIIAPTGAYAIQSSIPNLTIEVRGDNSIDGANNWSGIRLNKSATITGDGKLSVNAKGEGIGIFLYNDNNVTLTENIELTITGGTEVSAKGMSGISGYGGSVAIGKPYGAVLTVNNARVTAAFHGNTNVLNTGRRGGGLEYLHALNLNGVAIVSPSNAIFRPKQMSSVVDASTDAVIPEVVIGPTKNCYDVETEFSVEADGSYDWNGYVYTTSGDYQQVLQSVGGCDSTVTLHLTIQPAGKCGDNLHWTLKQSTGELVITGTGAMYDYISASVSGRAPWNMYSDVVKSVSLPDGITHIGNSAFNGMASISQAVVLPESVTSLGEASFSGCTALPGINIPSQITVIPQRLFNGCSTLRNLSIPAGVTSIGNEAFSGCWWAFSRAELVLPEGLLTIGDYAFSGDRFTSITIPASVTIIGEKAFRNCDSPYSYSGYSKGVAYYVNNPTPLVLSADVFNAETADVDTLHVPCGTEEAYSTANGWSSFANIIEPKEYSEFTETANDKYEWNGIEYTESGDYTQTFPMANGCDSIVTLHLTIVSTTGMESTRTDKIQCTTFLRDGVLYIRRGEKIYTAQGIMLK